jgi:alkanesulfonate monooxygenase SsuD/methylene tetrahydromethanopterin reductase-like flavin-dependent oxidoreductase (luciferase family)
VTQSVMAAQIQTPPVWAGASSPGGAALAAATPVGTACARPS